MSHPRYDSIAKLITSYNFEIKRLSEDLKCTHCKTVLKNACQVPCGCTFCRLCIDVMITNGVEFCPGGSVECNETLLSSATPDYKANKSVSKLTVTCINNGCDYECQLVDMEEHLQVCQRKKVKYNFLDVGFMQNKLASIEIDGHLQDDHRINSDILMGMIVNIKNEMEMLKHELVLKDGQIKTMADQLIHLENENKSIMNEIKSIKGEKEDLTDRVELLSQKIEVEITNRLEDDKLVTSTVNERVNREIAMITTVITSNKAELQKEIGSVLEDIQSINDDIESIEALVGLGQVDARFDWKIEGNLQTTSWNWRDKVSDCFSGTEYPYKYRLASENRVSSQGNTLIIWLRIYRGSSDAQLEWPFDGRVVIIVSEEDRSEVCRSVSQQCRIERPRKNNYKCSDRFLFEHSELVGAGLDLDQGVYVSCVIVPD